MLKRARRFFGERKGTISNDNVNDERARINRAARLSLSLSLSSVCEICMNNKRASARFVARSRRTNAALHYPLCRRMFNKLYLTLQRN